MPQKLAPRPPVVFAHPSEAEIARLLDFYNVQWEYEPRSFVLERDESGLPIKSFAPDFYLPDYDLYLEVTDDFDPRRYLRGKTWRGMEVRREVISVRNAAPGTLRR